MALHPPAQCSNPECKLIFPCTDYSMSNSIGISFAGCTGICPNCGSIATVGDGTYDFIGNQVSLISGPDSTVEMLKALARTVRDSVAAGESPEKTVERAAEFLPWLNGWKGDLAKFALGALATWALTKPLDHVYDSVVKESPAVIEQQLEDAAIRALEEAKRRSLFVQPPPPAPAAAPRPGTQRHPMLIEFPITAQKLADYEKESSKVNQFPRGLA